MKIMRLNARGFMDAGSCEMNLTPTKADQNPMAFISPYDKRSAGEVMNRAPSFVNLSILSKSRHS